MPDQFTSFQARLSAAGSSATQLVDVIRTTADTLRITGPDVAGGSIEVPLGECVFRPPLGRIRRVIELPDDSTLESDDLEIVDQLGSASPSGHRQRMIHHMESKWQWVLASIPILMLTVWIVYRFGIPAMAESVAFKLPVSTLVSASEGSIKLMDKLMFNDSELTEERQDEIRRGFDDVVAKLGSDDYEFELHFRSMNKVPNAMALPSGDIFVTDALINKAEADEEIFAVFAHELTHVERRHGMRMVLQDSGVFFLSAVMLGDVASAGAAISGAPAALANSGYSRNFENEADAGAAHYCVECGWTTSPMQTMLKRIAPPGGSAVAGWMSSHPDTKERVRRLKELEIKLLDKLQKEKAAEE